MITLHKSDSTFFTRSIGRMATALFIASLLVANGSAQSLQRGQRPADGDRASQPRQAPATKDTANVDATRQLIDELFQLASEATTVGEIQQALAQVERMRTQPLDNVDLQYLNELQAWLLNRRGEAYSQAAADSAEAGKTDVADAQEAQAQSDFSASIELHPHWRPYHNLGVSLAMQGDYGGALERFTAAIDQNPTYPNTRFNRAELWLELGKYELAEREYSQVLQLNPEDVDAWVGRGHTRFYLGRFEESLEDFNEVVRRQPQSAVALADRADLFAYLGRWEEAAKDYRAAIGIDRQLGRAFQSAAWLMATCPDESYRDTELALKAAERAIQLDGSEDYRYLDTLAAAQANAGQYSQAAETLMGAVDAAPEEIRPELKDRMTLYQAQRPYRDNTQ